MRFLRILHYTFKTLAYLLCALGCFYQVVSILNIYFSFPTTVFSFVENMKQLQLPALTICNNNRVMLSKLRSFDSKFDKLWTRLTNPSRRKTKRIKRLKNRLVERTIRDLMDRLSVNEFALLGHQWSDLISPDFFKCATDPFNLNNKCLKYSNIIETAQEEGNCFTVFGRSENDFLKNIAIKSGVSQSPIIRGTGDALNLEIAEQPFHPNELFRMMINFSIADYTTNYDKIMGYLMVHDENELPSIRERNYIIYPGFYYEIYVTKDTGKYLPKPYSTDCVNYEVDQVSQKVDDNTTATDNKKILSRESCIMNCMAENTVKWCRCWPPELPYVLSNSTEHRLKWCSWRDGINIEPLTNKSESSNWFRYCFSNHELDCNKRCKIQCRVDEFNSLRQSIIWPSNERMAHSTKYNHEHRKCCAIVSLRFWSSEQTTLKYEPKYEFVEFMSYFGGLLSMWLGFSFVKSYDIFEVVVQKGYKYIRSRNNGDGSIRRWWQSSNNKKQVKPKKSMRNNDLIHRPRVAMYYKTKHIHTSI